MEKRRRDLPVDMLAGGEHAPEPVGDEVHAEAFPLSLFMLVFNRSLPDEKLSVRSYEPQRAHDAVKS